MSFRAQRGRARRQTDNQPPAENDSVSERSGAARDAKLPPSQGLVKQGF